MPVRGPTAEAGLGPSAIFRRRLRAALTTRGWSLRQLASRLEELGYPLRASALNKIEHAQRDISLDDAVAIAVALEVPLPLLFLPYGDEDGVALTPGRKVHPDMALKWIACDEPMTGSDLSAWHKAVLPVQLHRAHDADMADLRAADSAVAAAEYVSDENAVVGARQRRLEVLEVLGSTRDEMKRQGVRPPALPRALQSALYKLGYEQKETPR